MQALSGDSSFDNVTSIGKINKEPVVGSGEAEVTIPSSVPVVIAPEAPAQVAAAAKPVSEKALTNRLLDFWLLGGLSIAIYLGLLFIAHTPLGQYQPVARHVLNMGATFTMLTLVVNFPHFMWSYKFAYSQSPQFIVKNWQQLLLAPGLLILILGMAYFSFTQSLQTHPLSQALNVMFGAAGLDTRISMYPNFGMQVLALLLIFQFAIVGWHYVKQTFGVMMTYSGYTGYPLQQWQRNLIRWNLFGIWWLFFLKANTGLRADVSNGVTYHSLNLPQFLTSIVSWYLGISLVAVIWFVFIDIYRKKKVLPSPSILAPFIAMYIWFVPPFDVVDYFALVVPFAHSLQYLCFVYKVESQAKKEKATKDLAINLTWLICSVLVAGFFFIEVLPGMIDEGLHLPVILGLGFFGVAFQIFINIHHYFIDNCIWQKKNQEIKKHLFA